LQNGGFEVLANGPDGHAQADVDEVPKWRDVVAKPASNRFEAIGPPTLRITAIAEKAVPVGSTMRNAASIFPK